MPFLEVITRCYKRPVMLRANMASLKRQTDGDWTQSFIVDTVGLGIEHSYERMAAFPVAGDYIWILDDDDACAHDALVEELKAIAAAHNPEIIMVKMDHGGRVLPGDADWGGAPRLGHIGCSAAVTRRDVWERHRHAFTPGHYNSDFHFVRDVFDDTPNIYWHDVIASRVQRISKGAPE